MNFYPLTNRYSTDILYAKPKNNARLSVSLIGDEMPDLPKNDVLMSWFADITYRPADDIAELPYSSPCKRSRSANSTSTPVSDDEDDARSSVTDIGALKPDSPCGKTATTFTTELDCFFPKALDDAIAERDDYEEMDKYLNFEEFDKHTEYVPKKPAPEVILESCVPVKEAPIVQPPPIVEMPEIKEVELPVFEGPLCSSGWGEEFNGPKHPEESNKQVTSQYVTQLSDACICTHCGGWLSGSHTEAWCPYVIEDHEFDQDINAPLSLPSLPAKEPEVVNLDDDIPARVSESSDPRAPPVELAVYSNEYVNDDFGMVAPPEYDAPAPRCESRSSGARNLTRKESLQMVSEGMVQGPLAAMCRREIGVVCTASGIFNQHHQSVESVMDKVYDIVVAEIGNPDGMLQEIAMLYERLDSKAHPKFFRVLRRYCKEIVANRMRPASINERLSYGSFSTFYDNLLSVRTLMKPRCFNFAMRVNPTTAMGLQIPSHMMIDVLYKMISFCGVKLPTARIIDRGGIRISETIGDIDLQSMTIAQHPVADKAVLGRYSQVTHEGLFFPVIRLAYESAEHIMGMPSKARMFTAYCTNLLVDIPVLAIDVYALGPWDQHDMKAAKKSILSIFSRTTELHYASRAAPGEFAFTFSVSGSHIPLGGYKHLVFQTIVVDNDTQSRRVVRYNVDESVDDIARRAKFVHGHHVTTSRRLCVKTQKGFEPFEAKHMPFIRMTPLATLHIL